MSASSPKTAVGPQALPALRSLYLRALATSRGRRGDRLPEVTEERQDLAVDRAHLSRYQEVCGFRQRDVLPATYPHVLAFPLAVSIMVDDSFPFALPGLVHVGNRIEQKRAIGATERMTLTVRATDLRPHPRGRQFDMSTEVEIDGQPIWSEMSTYLRRERRSTSGAPREPAHEETPPSAIWRVPADTGRRYAAVSGDVNPIHLNPLAARLFGFPRAIAHGMWLKARCLSALEGRLGDAVTAEVEFKSPLLLPSTVAFRSRPEDGRWLISVVHAASGRPHLAGVVR